MPQTLQANAHLVRRVSDLKLDPVLIFPADASLSDLALRDEPGTPEHVVVVNDGGPIVGVAARAWLLEQAEREGETRKLADVARGDFVTISESSTLVDLLSQMTAGHASAAVVLHTSAESGGRDATPVAGLITQSAMAEALAAGIELFGD